MASGMRLFIFVVASYAVSFSSLAFAVVSLPQSMTIEGRFFNDGTGTPINTNVDVRFEIYSAANAACVLYREDFNDVDVSSTDPATEGVYAIRLGLGSRAGNLASIPLSQIMSNSQNQSGDSNGDNTTDCTVTAASLNGSHRMLRMFVVEDAGGTNPAKVLLSPDTAMTPAPSALVAETLNGREVDSFIQVRDDGTHTLTQANVEQVFADTAFTKLMDLINGSSNQYMSASPSTAIDFNGQRITDVAAPSAASDAVNRGYADGYVGGKAAVTTGVSNATGDGYTLVWDQAGERWVAQAPTTTDNTKLPLAGGTMSGPITLAGHDVANTGYIIMNPSRYLQVSNNAIDPVGLAAGHEGAVWWDSTGNQLKLWDGTAARQVMHLDGTSKLNAGWIPDTAVSAGTYGSATTVPTFTVAADGRLTAAAAVTISGVAPSGAAGGDLTGTFPNPTIANDKLKAAMIQSASVAINRLIITDSTTPNNLTYAECSNGQLLMWNPSGWLCTDLTDVLGLSGATAGTYGSTSQVAQVTVDAQGRVIAATDVAITFPVTTVAGRSGNVSLNALDIDGLGTAAVQDVGLNAGDVVQLDGAGKIDASLLPAGTGDIEAVAAGNGLLGGGLSGSVALSVDAGAGANQIVQLDATSKLPAVDGSNLTNVQVNVEDIVNSATGYLGYRPGNNQCTDGASLKWDSGNGRWICGTAVPDNAIVNGGNSLSQAIGIGSTDSYPLSFLTGGTSRMTIDTTGRVGFGIAFPTYALGLAYDRNSIGVERHPTSNTQGTSLSIQAGGAATLATNKNGGDLRLRSGISTGTGSSGVIFETSPGAGSGSSDNALVERMRITGNGRVGVGTTAPDELLHVLSSINGAAAMKVENFTSSISANAGINIVNGGSQAYLSVSDYSWETKLETNAPTIRLNASGPNGAVEIPNRLRLLPSTLGTGTAGDLAVDTLGNELKFHDGSSWTTLGGGGGTSLWQLNGSDVYYDSGNVGIGTMVPSRPLHIIGSMRLEPSVLPASPAAGDIAVDLFDSNTLKFHNGSGWVSVGSGGGGGDFLSDGSVDMSGSIRLPDGSEVAPSLTFSNNPGTGIYYTSPSNMGFSSGGASKMIVGAASIEATVPIRAPSFSFEGNPGTGLFAPIMGHLSLQTNGSAAMHIDQLGNVGIGTTTPGEKLDVRGGGIFYSDEQSPGINLSVHTDYFSSSPQVNQQLVGQRTLLNYQSNYAFTGASSKVAAIEGRAAISTSGNVEHLYGVHSTAVNQSGTATNIYGVRGGYETYSGSVDNAYGIYAQGTSSGGTILNGYGVYIGDIGGTNKYGVYQYASNATNYFAGKVGIGDSAPRASLDVKGAIISAETPAVVAAMVDFATGNIQYTTNSCGGFTLRNMKNGGSYTFVVQGTSSTTCSFSGYSDGGITLLAYHPPVGHGPTIAGKHTIYNFLVVNGHVYASWTPGL